MTKHTSEHLPLSVEWDDESNIFVIDWDENDPRTSMFNDWTQEDFLEAITKGLNARVNSSLEEQ